MNVLFKDDMLKQLEADSSFDGGFQSAVVKKYRKCIQYIWAAKDERDFYAMKSLNFEKLSGKRKGQYSMRLNLQWRLILEIRGDSPNKDIVIIGIEDYH